MTIHLTVGSAANADGLRPEKQKPLDLRFQSRWKTEDARIYSCIEETNTSNSTSNSMDSVTKSEEIVETNCDGRFVNPSYVNEREMQLRKSDFHRGGILFGRWRDWRNWRVNDDENCGKKRGKSRDVKTSRRQDVKKSRRQDVKIGNVILVTIYIALHISGEY